MKTNLLFCTALIMASLCHAPAALAEKGGNGNGKGHSKSHKSDSHDRHGRDHGEHDHENRGGESERVVIQSSDRMMIRDYIAQDYHSECPPGLAKKNNGCLPPGQAKKRYSIGHSLPDIIQYHPVPQPLLVQLHPVPVGYQYVMVDKDVLLIAEGSKKVIDAITLFSAVGK